MLVSSLSLVTAPAAEMIDAEDLRRHVGLFDSQQDDMLDRKIAVAREQIEETTRRQYMKATWSLRLPCWWGSGVLEIPRPPLLSVSSISYVDTDGNSQTLSTSVYGVLTKTADSPFGGVYRKRGQSWPSLYGDENALEVTITFVCGYSAAAAAADQRAAVPVRARQLNLMLAADLFENREVGGVGPGRIPDNPQYLSMLSKLEVPTLTHTLEGA